MQTHTELFKNQMGWRQYLNRMSGLFLKMLHQNMKIQACMLAKPTQRWANRISNIVLLICGILITQLGSLRNITEERQIIRMDLRRL